MAQLGDPLREVLLPRLTGVKKAGNQWMAQCPAHADKTASLAVTAGTSQPVILTCHAGCERDQILKAVGLTWTDLCKPRDEPAGNRGEWTPYGAALAVYDYLDEESNLLFQVVRCPGKRFMQRRPDKTAKSGWAWKLEGTRRVIYRLPDVIKAARSGELIYVCEGEKDVHSMERAGVVATCNPGGAGPGKWLPEYREPFRDAVVIIIADRDEPGRLHARRIADALRPVASAVEIWEPASGKDATDHLAAGLGIKDFNRAAAGDEPRADLDPDLHEFLSVIDPPEDWVIQDLLERSERLVITGIEGYGKSTLLRQAAVCTAAGIHLFKGERMRPEKVLFVDCENTERQSRRRFRSLAEIAKVQRAEIAPGYLRLIHRPEGVDLTREDDAAWLMERVALYKPALLVVGPLYRLHAADTNDELPARRVAQVLDAARTAVGCALMLEAHSGHASDGRKRSLRPIGSSLFLRWPEYGFGMDPVEGKEAPKNLFNFLPWRGGRDQRTWPKQVIWSQGLPGETGWPWQEYKPPAQAPQGNPAADRQFKDQ